jgi:TonB family protein
MIVGAEDQTFLFSASSRSGPDNGRLPLRLEAKLDTLSYVGGNDKVSGKIDLFQTLCSVTHGHPLVIGRPLPENRHGEKRAFFLVFTPFFREITGPGVYDLLLKDFRNVLKVSTSTFGLDVKNLFDSINRYFQKKFQMDDLKSITAQIPELGEARKESDKDEIFYTPYDRPPSPVGGYSVLQKRLVYPEIARKSGIEGKVLVYALVSAEGRIEQVKVMQSLIGCDEAAIDAVRSVRWQPAIGENGKPVKVWVMVPIEFRLK